MEDVAFEINLSCRESIKKLKRQITLNHLGIIQLGKLEIQQFSNSTK